MKDFIFQSKFSMLLTVAAIVAALIIGGTGAAFVTLILIAIEIAFSFDNAIINAKILKTLSPFWQKMFLTVGVVLAIFGMRIVFPIAVVALAAHLPWHEVLSLALNHPAQYAHHLEAAHTLISAFGGAFLLMLTLSFFLDRERKITWIHWFERPLQRFGTWWLAPILAVLIVLLFAFLPWNHHFAQTLRGGLFGVAAYGVMQLLLFAVGLVTDGKQSAVRTGKAALVTFIYLQLLDASFSFDGVIGAFAITKDIVLIALGLGIGAIWVRTLTVYMVKRGTLEAYQYLEHGAHYAVGTLAFAMLVSILIDVPDVITGIVTLGLIGSSLVASRQALRA